MKIRFRIYAVIILFLASIVVIAVPTIQKTWPSIETKLKTNTFGVNALESEIQQNMAYKNLLIELQGGIHKAMGRKMTNDAQFYLSDDGLIHLRRDQKQYQSMLDSVVNLSNILSQRNIPLFICQVAERSYYGDVYSRFIDGVALEYIFRH